jgi:hypothetical protein
MIANVQKSGVYSVSLIAEIIFKLKILSNKTTTAQNNRIRLIIFLAKSIRLGIDKY